MQLKHSPDQLYFALLEKNRNVRLTRWLSRIGGISRVNKTIAGAVVPLVDYYSKDPALVDQFANAVLKQGIKAMSQFEGSDAWIDALDNPIDEIAEAIIDNAAMSRPNVAWLKEPLNLVERVGKLFQAQYSRKTEDLAALGYAERWTDAPVDYDGKRTRRTGEKRKMPTLNNKVFEHVYIHPEDLDWQERRYGSGLHGAWDPQGWADQLKYEEKSKLYDDFSDVIKKMQELSQEAQKWLLLYWNDGHFSSQRPWRYHVEPWTNQKDARKAIAALNEQDALYKTLPEVLQKDQWALDARSQDLRRMANAELKEVVKVENRYAEAEKKAREVTQFLIETGWYHPTKPKYFWMPDVRFEVQHESRYNRPVTQSLFARMTFFAIYAVTPHSDGTVSIDLRGGGSDSSGRALTRETVITLDWTDYLKNRFELANKMNLKFPLLPDLDRDAISAFGLQKVWTDGNYLFSGNQTYDIESYRCRIYDLTKNKIMEGKMIAGKKAWLKAIENGTLKYIGTTQDGITSIPYSVYSLEGE